MVILRLDTEATGRGSIWKKVPPNFFWLVALRYQLENEPSNFLLVSHVKITNDNQIITQESLTYIFVTNNVSVFQLEEMT